MCSGFTTGRGGYPEEEVIEMTEETRRTGTQPTPVAAPPVAAPPAATPPVAHEHPATLTETREPIRARGGFSPFAVITGVLASWGAMVLIGGLVGGILVALDVTAADVTAGAGSVGIGVGVGVFVAQFLAYLWGGYTAGRMARGAGAMNGFLVPLTALIIGGIVAGVVLALGTEPDINIPGITGRPLPVDRDFGQSLGIWIAVGAFVAMFAGAITGGMLGVRWHARLEDSAAARRVVLP